MRRLMLQWTVSPVTPASLFAPATLSAPGARHLPALNDEFGDTNYEVIPTPERVDPS